MADVATDARQGPALRVAVIGVLANQKGAVTVMTVASAADPAELSIHVIGYAEQALPEPLAARIAMTGQYAESELPALLAKVKPHVVWFPAQWPETYSYTLSAAIDAGLPIVATRIGAFPERLEGRPLTWLVDPEASTEEWLAVFAEVRSELTRQRKPPAGASRAHRWRTSIASITSAPRPCAPRTNRSICAATIGSAWW